MNGLRFFLIGRTMQKDFFVNKVLNFINKEGLINYGDRIVLGVSGGADSVALLLVLFSLSEEYNLNLKVVTVNHGLRDEAYEESEYVKKLCEERNIGFVPIYADVAGMSKEMGKGTEETGRMVRYKAFEKEASEWGEGTKIAVAHTKNDVSETMLFHLFRGTGVKGLSSISPKRSNIIRPLLCATRKEIEEWLLKQKIRFYVDASNLTDEYTRNKIRHNIVDYAVKEINRGAVEHMAETASALRDLQKLAENTVNDIVETNIYFLSKDKLNIKKTAFDYLNDYIRCAVVKECIDRIIPFNKDITKKHLELVLEIAQKTEQRTVHLPYGIKVLSEADTVSFSLEEEDDFVFEETALLSLQGEFKNLKFGTVKWRVLERTSEYVYSQNEYTKCLDYDKIINHLVFRKVMPGDYILIGGGHHKKVSDYLIDNKVPASLRKRVIVAADGNHVMWLVGFRISEGAKITEETARVIELEVEPVDEGI